MVTILCVQLKISNCTIKQADDIKIYLLEYKNMAIKICSVKVKK